MHRLTSLLICLALTMTAAGAEWRLCASMAPSAHGCCEDAAAPSLDVPDCCAISQGTGAPLTTEVSIVPTTLQVVPMPASLAPFFVQHPQVAPIVAPNLARPSVPLYLRHSSLLI